MDKSGEEELESKKEPEEPKETEASEVTEEGSAAPKYLHSSPSQIFAGPKRSGKKIPFLLGIAVIVLILGGLFYFLRARTETEVEPSPSPVTFIEEPTSLPSPSPGFDRSTYTLRVLNGTKTQALAASTSAKLKDLGYKIERTGNATNSAFLKTFVRVKPNLDPDSIGVEDLLENLLKDLSGLDFEGEEGPELKESDSADGEVILGAE